MNLQVTSNVSTILSQITQAIKEASKVGIITHINPDGDAIGSMVAMSELLSQMSKDVVMYAPEEDVSDFYCLSGMEDIKSDIAGFENLDLLLALDCGSESRIVSYSDFRDKVPKVINIDHHLDNTQFGDINWSDNYAAVGEMVYLFAKENQLEITKDIANAIFVSLYMDTGGFRYSNTSSFTMRVAAEMLEMGIDSASLISSIYENKNLLEIKHFGEILAEVKSDESGSIVWSFQPLEAQHISLEPVNYLRKIQGIKVAVIFKEREKDFYKVSFRSSGDVDVRVIASELGGGGHTAAAGAVVKGSMQDVEEKVIDLIKKYIG